MKKLNLIIIILILFAAITRLHADDKVRIILHRPPPNQMDIGDMWNITLTNTTKEDLKIYLTGTATEEKDGLIVEGKSKVFTIKPGKTSYKYNDFTGAEIKYNNSKYKEIMLRQGNAPEGNYTICVTAFLESGDIAGQENCIIHPVNQMGSITLISPEDGGEITREQPIIFSWTPLPGAKDYTLRIVEIKGDQSPEVAMKTNKPVWEKSGITTTTTQVPYIAIDEPGLKIMDKKKKWGWQVVSGEIVSDVWAFSASSSCFTLEIVDSLSCDPDKKNEYFIRIIFHNNSSSLTNCTMTINNVSVAGFTLSPTITSFVVAPGGTHIYDGKLIGTGSGGTIITNASSSSGLTQDMPNQFNLPRCSCCGSFVKRVEKVDVRKESSNLVWSSHIFAGPNPIKNVTAEMVYFYQNWKDTNCAKCVTDSKVMGNFSGGSLGGFGAGSLASPPWATGYSREIDFSSTSGVDMNSGKPLTLNLELPSQSNLECCADTIRLCIRFSFTDTACVTCDTVICRKIVRTSTGISSGAGGIKISDDVIILQDSKSESKREEISYAENTSSLPPGYNVTFTPTTGDCCFEVSVTNTTSSTNWNTFQIMSSFNPITSVNPVSSTTNPSTISSPVTEVAWMRGSGGFPVGTSSYGTVCFNNTTDPFIIFIRWSTNSGATYTNWDEVDTIRCQPQESGCDVDSCRTTSLNISTGFNHVTNSVYAVGEQDVFWTLVEAPTSNGSVTIGGPAFVILNGSTSWDGPITGSRYISAFATSSSNLENIDDIDTPYVFERCFCVCDSIAELTISVNVHVDNRLNLYFVDGNTSATTTILSLSSTSTSYFIDPPETATITVIVSKGTHCIKAELRNDDTNSAMGLDIQGTITGPTMLRQTCCSHNSFLSGYKVWDKDCNGERNSGDVVLSGWVINLVNSSGVTVATATTDVNGYYLFTDVEPGTYTLTENLQSGWVQSGILFTNPVTIGDNEAISDLTFLNCKDTTSSFGDCCDNFDINITSSVSQAFPTNPFIYRLNSNITAGPNRISKVRAFLSNYEIKTSNPDCDRCMNKPLFNGSLLPVIFSSASNISGLSGPVVTSLSTLTQSANPRELVWGGDGLSSVNLSSGIPLGLWVIVPAPSLITCCADTIKFCMKYSFTDTTCVTCDTMICYQIVRPPKSTFIPYSPEKEFKKLEQDFRKHMEEIEKKDKMRRKENGSSYNENSEEKIYITETNEIRQTVNTIGSGNSAGVINLTVNNTSSIKIRIYDSQGKEILKLYDDYLKGGQYSFDLNKYNLPEGVYFYRIETEGENISEKVLITKQTSGCNCGKK